MNTLARIREGVLQGDLVHDGRPEHVALYVMATEDGIVLVDPGPTTCLERLRALLHGAGADIGDVRHVLLTHIHLDHAGATGSLVRENERLTVHVSRHGAPHLADPARLLASAARLYGEDMDRLWGPVLPTPAGRLSVLDGGERLTIGRRKLRVAYTPGHAVHHLCFLDDREGLAFVGDLAGEASQLGTPPLPASPPPDVDLGLWRSSLDLVMSWRPVELLLTHFGPVRDPGRHVDQVWQLLVDWSVRVRESLELPGVDDARSAAFAADEAARLKLGLTPEQAAHIDPASILASWYGLARYWRGQPAAGDAAARA